MFLNQAKTPYFLLYSLPLALAACSGNSSGAKTTAPEDGGAGDAGAPTLSFNVVEAEATKTPIAGALAYVEYTDGKNESAKSDATGKVTFASASVASGVESVTFGTAARSVQSYVEPNLASLAGAPIALPLLAGPTSYKLSGGLKPVTSGDSVLMQPSILPVDAVLGDDVTASSTYSFTLPGGSLFTIYGSEYLLTKEPLTRGFTATFTKWFHVEHPALASNTTFDIDLTSLPSDTSMTANGVIEIPGGDAGPLGGASTAVVLILGQNGQSTDGLPNIGFTTSIRSATDNSAFIYSVEYVPYPNVTPITYAQITAVDGSLSLIDVPGFPTAGQKIDGLALPVALSGPLAEGSEIDATVASAGQFVTIQVNLTAGDPSVFTDAWDVSLPPGKISKVPVLSPAIKALLPSGSLSALVQTQSTLTVLGTLTRSRTVAITP